MLHHRSDHVVTVSELGETLAWRDHEDIRRTRAAVASVTGAWRQLERYIGRYLPATLADPSWILWVEAWARAPHNRQVSKFLEELMAPWRDALAAIVARGVREGTFAPPADISDFTLRFNALLDGSRSFASGKASPPVSASSSLPWPPPAPS